MWSTTYLLEFLLPNCLDISNRTSLCCHWICFFVNMSFNIAMETFLSQKFRIGRYSIVTSQYKNCLKIYYMKKENKNKTGFMMKTSFNKIHCKQVTQKIIYCTYIFFVLSLSSCAFEFWCIVFPLFWLFKFGFMKKLVKYCASAATHIFYHSLNFITGRQH